MGDETEEGEVKGTGVVLPSPWWGRESFTREELLRIRDGEPRVCRERRSEES